MGMKEGGAEKLKATRGLTLHTLTLFTIDFTKRSILAKLCRVIHLHTSTIALQKLPIWTSQLG